MGKKSTPKAPETPNYVEAAQEQGRANLDASRVGAELTNTNQVTPYGNQTFTKDPNSDQWTSTIQLSPEQQALYNNQVAGQQQLGQTANGMLGRVSDMFGSGFDTSGLASRVDSINAPNYARDGGDPNAPVSALDFSAAGPGSTMEDFKTQAKDVQDALYRQATSTLDPEWTQRGESERSRLLNTGLVEGSEAYNNAMDRYDRQRRGAYGDARDRSIQAGVGTQSTMNQNALASRAQMLAQILQGGTFQNDAAQQTFNNKNSVLGQQFGADLTSGNFQNQARAAGMDEQSYLRSLPLNEYNSLMTGAQVTNPAFRNTGQVQGPAAAPVFAGAQAQGQNALDLYNQQMAQRNSAMGGIAGLLGSGLEAAGSVGGFGALFSDRRLKSDIEPIGKWRKTGLTAYSYVIFGKPQIGVMADEAVLKYPAAVKRDEYTYDTVDYAKLDELAEAA